MWSLNSKHPFLSSGWQPISLRAIYRQDLCMVLITFCQICWFCPSTQEGDVMWLVELEWTEAITVLPTVDFLRTGDWSVRWLLSMLSTSFITHWIKRKLCTCIWSVDEDAIYQTAGIKKLLVTLMGQYWLFLKYESNCLLNAYLTSYIDLVPRIVSTSFLWLTCYYSGAGDKEAHHLSYIRGLSERILCHRQQD